MLCATMPDESSLVPRPSPSSTRACSVYGFSEKALSILSCDAYEARKREEGTKLQTADSVNCVIAGRSFEIGNHFMLK